MRVVGESERWTGTGSFAVTGSATAEKRSVVKNQCSFRIDENTTRRVMKKKVRLGRGEKAKRRWTYSEEAAALTVVLTRAVGLAAALAMMGVPTRKAAIVVGGSTRK